MGSDLTSLNFSFYRALHDLTTTGLVVREDRELLAFSLNLKNPRNRLLSFANLNTNLSDLLSVSMIGIDAVFNLEHELALVELAQDLGSRDVVTRINGTAFNWHWIVRNSCMNLMIHTFETNVFDDFQRDVFLASMVQEAMYSRLRTAYPWLKLGSLYYRADCLFLHGSDRLKAEETLSTHYTHDAEMIPMENLTTSIWKAVKAGDEVPYWSAVTRAFNYNCDVQAMMKIFEHEY